MLSLTSVRAFPTEARVLNMHISLSPVSTLMAVLLISPAIAEEPRLNSTAEQPPRKVIVGSVVHPFWGKYPGLQNRLDQLAGIIDRMSDESQKKYGRGLDLAALPEVAVNGEVSGDITDHSVPFEGPVRETFAKVARKHHCYVIVPMFLLEDKEKRLCSNVAIVLGRDGEVIGTYRKLHLAVPEGSDSMEAGTTPGKEVPVFKCDFGKLGVQICFDMEYDFGWRELARKGAELVVWTTQAPGTSHPAFRSMQHRYYVLSSTWRNNVSLFEPTGKITAQVRPPGEILVQEIDLSYALLPWSSRLRNGAALKEKYGDKVGFRYYEDEDAGIFWSNDPQLTIGKMYRSLGMTEIEPELRRIRKLYDKAGVPGN